MRGRSHHLHLNACITDTSPDSHKVIIISVIIEARASEDQVLARCVQWQSKDSRLANVRNKRNTIRVLGKAGTTLRLTLGPDSSLPLVHRSRERVVMHKETRAMSCVQACQICLCCRLKHDRTGGSARPSSPLPPDPSCPAPLAFPPLFCVQAARVPLLGTLNITGTATKPSSCSPTRPPPSADYLPGTPCGNHREGHASKMSVHAVHAAGAAGAVDAVDAKPKHEACACQHVTHKQDTSGAGHYMVCQCGGAAPLSRRS